MNSVLAALDYAASGFKVLPVHGVVNGKCTCEGFFHKPCSTKPGKHPVWKDWGNKATTSQAVIRDAFSKDFNVGIKTGHDVGIFVLDIDTGGEEDGFQTLKELEKKHGPLPITPISHTGGGGVQYFFKSFGDIKGTVRILPGIDIRGNGNQVVVAPSNHISGRQYAWDVDYDFKTPLAEAPLWLKEMVLSQGKAKEEKKFDYAKYEKIGDGQRNDVLFKLACSLQAKGLSNEAIKASVQAENTAKCTPPLTEAEVDEVIKSAFKYAKGEIKKTEGNEEKRKKEPSAYELAEKFLVENEFYDKDGNSTLRYYRQDFYRFKENHYQQIEDDWFKDRLNRWLVSVGHHKYAGTSKVKAILENIQTMPRFVGGKITLPAFEGETDWKSTSHLIPLKNGLFDAKHFLEQPESDPILLGHTPKYFCPYALPYDYDPNALCPIFEGICDDILQNEEEKLALFEMMGVHLYTPFLVEKFFVLSGEGANGKSVIRTVLTALLGEENVSSVGLENFNANSFSFAGTLGKLANIIPDMKDIQEIDEGALKAFVSRESMPFNRKFKDPISAAPSAYLTVCTNVLPKFGDKSDGIWRRMWLLDFKKQIPQEKQNTQFRKMEFWQNNGELSGIFNKAMEGLFRVFNRGYLLETESMKNEVSEYKFDLDNIAQFIEEKIEFDAHGSVSTDHMYMVYTQFCDKAGYRQKLARNTFTRRLKSELIKKGHKHPLSDKNMGHSKGRVWLGMSAHQDTVTSFV